MGERILEPGWLTAAYPRCVHVGRCGGISFRLEAQLGVADAVTACNVTSDFEVFSRTWVLPMLEGGALAPEAEPHGGVPTMSIVAQEMAANALVRSLARRGGFDEARFKANHPGGALGASLGGGDRGVLGGVLRMVGL